MSWQVGDLALRITSEPLPEYPRGYWSPAIGSVSTVSDVRAGTDMRGVKFTGLWFAEDPTPDPFAAWDATHFRKITPGAKIEGVEERRRLPLREDA